MGKGGEMNTGKGDESGGHENPNYPVVIGEDGVPRIGACAVDPLQSFKSTELQLWPIFGNKLSFARPHMRAFHFQWLSFFMAFMVWFAYAPLLVVIRQDLDIPKKGIWMSNVFNVAACVVARFVVGPLGDVYGSVKVQTALLGFCGICTFFAGFVNSLAELCLMRFLIGVGGATFVITQLWSSEMFAKNVVGAANAMTGGWGNCGGGMAIMIMGYIYEGFRDEGLSQEQAWRRSFYIPAVVVLLVCVCMFFFSDECPSGKLSDALAAGKREKVTVKESTRGGFTNLNSWILFIQYATCFGIELHINNGMAMYFKDTYPVSLATAGLIASLFGWMNLFARGLGGYFSDLANAKLGMQGRIIVHTLVFARGGRDPRHLLARGLDRARHHHAGPVLVLRPGRRGHDVRDRALRRAESSGQRLGRRRRGRQRRRRGLGPDVHVRRQRQDGLPQPGHHHHGLCFVVGLHQDQGRWQSLRQRRLD